MSIYQATVDSACRQNTNEAVRWLCHKLGCRWERCENDEGDIWLVGKHGHITFQFDWTNCDDLDDVPEHYWITIRQDGKILNKLCHDEKTCLALIQHFAEGSERCLL